MGDWLATPKSCVTTVVACCMVVMFAGAPVQAQAQDNAFDSEKVADAARKSLHDDIDSRGVAHVLVRIAKPSSVLSSPSAANLRQRLSERLSVRLATRQPNNQPFEFIPYVALVVDRGDLELLERAPEVVSIEEDVLLLPLLDKSADVVGAVNGWDLGFSGAGATVAVLDTGVDATHSAFGDRVVEEACFSTTSSSSESLCENGSEPEGVDEETGPGAAAPCREAGCDHGTHVAGIVAGGDAEFRGVAYEANLIAVQVFSRFQGADCDGAASCVLARTSDLLRGMDYVHSLRNRHKIAAVNLSLGGGAYFSPSDCDFSNSAMKAAIDRLRRVGIATVAAAGNDGFSDGLASPACISSAISVGSTTIGDRILGSSNTSSWLTLLAPGRTIKSTVPNQRYRSKTGTSMAAPHVAGALAMLRSQRGGIGVDRMVEALRTTGRSVTDQLSGNVFPRIQIDDALASLGDAPPPPSPPPERDDKPEPLAVTVDALAVATVDKSYSQTLGAEGGNPPYTWRVSRGGLDAGLSLSVAGVLKGIPQRVSSKLLTFEVRDSDGHFVRRTLRLTIAPQVSVAAAPLELVTTTLRDAQAGNPYSEDLVASGGKRPLSWTLEQGSLPDGLSLDDAGRIRGAATVPGVSTFKVAVRDSDGKALRRTFTIVVSDEGGGAQTSLLLR